MKVVQISEADKVGGAAIAASRLNRGLRVLGVDSCMLVNIKVDQDESVIGPTSRFDKIISRVSPLLERLPRQFSKTEYDLISSAWLPDRVSGRLVPLDADILNLHWINKGFMRIETLRKLKQPIVWTLHDMWPFCGGEHYTGESERYKKGYRFDNRPAGESGLDINRWIWLRKKKTWAAKKNMVIVTPSKWLAGCAAESVLFREHRIEVLPNGIDHERFHPIDRLLARQILGLPADKKLILFGAGFATSDKRKGFHLLVEALNRLEAKYSKIDYELVIFGASSGDSSFSAKAHYLGNLHDEISMAIIYAAADIFVLPSLEDNLPNTVLEALSCGTPVASFNIGGMPDMIEHERNGFMAPAFDTDLLAEGIAWILADTERWKDLSASARKTIEQSFTLKHFATRYLDLYRDILD
ncbi:MAG TPA: glycosyltransferase [Gammaproteobacteria bacterium]|nr:glycosyltransferase [Gammaproteobacteria bacterium]